MGVITDLADGTLRAVESAADSAAALFEPTLRLGVTGLNRSGKTVFITSLVANLLARGRMTMLRAEGEGRIEAAMLRPQPDPEIPRFEYEEHRADLSGPAPRWPESTRRISELRLSLRYRRTSLLGALRGTGTLHLDIVDYPGEWLLDLPLIGKGWAEWSREAIEAARTPERAAHAAPFLAWAEARDPGEGQDEMTAKEGARLFADYLKAVRAAGLTAVSPGRFLMPGDLEGSPALTFAPLIEPEGRSGSLARLMGERYEAYKRIVVRPFFRDHFTRLDRQVVLVDALDAIDAGPRAVADLRKAMSEILACFRHGSNTWLSALTGKRIDRLLFAATKADHIHHSQHDRLEAILRALLRESIERADYKGARTKAVALASIRATTEQVVRVGGETFDCVRGRDPATGKDVVVYPGTLPDDPDRIVEAARRGTREGEGSGGWLSDDYAVMRFAPPVLTARPGFGPPHLRLDRAAEFLIGDRLR